MVTKAVKIRIKDSSACKVLNRMARSINFVWNYCVRRDVSHLIVAENATCSPMNSTLRRQAWRVTSGSEALRTMYPKVKASFT